MELGHRDQHPSQPWNIERGFAAWPSYEDLMKRDGSVVGIRGVVKSNSGGLNADVLDSTSDHPTNVTQKTSIRRPTTETQPSNSFGPTLPSTNVVSPLSQGKTKRDSGHKSKLQKNEPTTLTTNTIPVIRSHKHLDKAQRREARLRDRVGFDYAQGSRWDYRYVSINSISADLISIIIIIFIAIGTADKLTGQAVFAFVTLKL